MMSKEQYSSGSLQILATIREFFAGITQYQAHKEAEKKLENTQSEESDHSSPPTVAPQQPPDEVVERM